jgi:hypothetical protein
MHDHESISTIDVTDDDKNTIEIIVNDLSGFLRPPIEPGQTEDIFDNRTLDIFMKNIILMLNDIRTEGNISKYTDVEGNLKVKV